MKKKSDIKTGMPTAPETATENAQSPEVKESLTPQKIDEERFEKAKEEFIENRREERKKREEKLKSQGKNEKEIEKVLNIEEERDIKKFEAGYKAAKGGTEKEGEGQKNKDKEKDKNKDKEKKLEEKAGDKKEAVITKEKLYADVGKWREELIKREAAYKKAKEEGIMGESILEMHFEEAKKSYEKARIGYADFLYKRKLSLLEGESGRPEYNQELCELKGSLFRDVLIREQDELAKAKYDNLAPRKRTWFRSMLENYIKAPMWKRVAVSTAVVTGTIATGGLLGGLFGLSFGFASGAAAAGYGAQRFARGVIGGAAGGYVAGWIKRYFGRKVEEDRAREIEALQNSFGMRLDNINSEREWKDLIRDADNNYERIVRETNRRHRNITLWASGGALVAGLGSVSAITHAGLDGPLADLLNSKLGFAAPATVGAGGGAASILEQKPKTGFNYQDATSRWAGQQQDMDIWMRQHGGGAIPPQEALGAGGAKAGVEHLQIGARGPEGAIIDYLKGKGMPGDEAGVKAHGMFLDYMKEHNVANQEEFLEKMKHIGKGGLSITPDGKIDLVDMEYLRFKAPMHVPGELVEPVEKTIVPGELIAPDEKIVAPGELVEPTVPLESMTGVGETIRIAMEKIWDIADKGGFSGKLNTALQNIGGPEKLMDLNAYELFSRPQPGYLQDLAKSIAESTRKQFSVEAWVDADRRATLKDLLKVIEYKK